MSLATAASQVGDARQASIEVGVGAFPAYFIETDSGNSCPKVCSGEGRIEFTSEKNFTYISPSGNRTDYEFDSLRGDNYQFISTRYRAVDNPDITINILRYGDGHRTGFTGIAETAPAFRLVYGFPTEIDRIPTLATARYSHSGSTTAFMEGVGKNKIVTGDSGNGLSEVELNVDFGARKIDGFLAKGADPSINLGSEQIGLTIKVNGATFSQEGVVSGTDVLSAQIRHETNSEVKIVGGAFSNSEIHGRFMGKNADNLIGYYAGNLTLEMSNQTTQDKDVAGTYNGIRRQ